MPTLRLTVRARPGSSTTRVGGAHGADQALLVAVNAPPVDGAASESVLKAVAAALGIKRRQISILTGHTSRTKVLELDLSESEAEPVADKLAQLVATR